MGRLHSPVLWSVFLGPPGNLRPWTATGTRSSRSVPPFPLLGWSQGFPSLAELVLLEEGALLGIIILMVWDSGKCGSVS